MNVWRLVPHDQDKEAALAWAERNNRIAIGWGKIGDLKTLAPSGPDDIAEAIKQAYTDAKPTNCVGGGTSLWSFYHDMQEDDLVILRDPNGKTYVMEVMGDYEWVEDKVGQLGHYQHQRKAEVTELDPDRTLERAKLNPAIGESPRRALIRVGKIETTTGLSR